MKAVGEFVCFYITEAQTLLTIHAGKFSDSLDKYVFILYTLS